MKRFLMISAVVLFAGVLAAPASARSGYQKVKGEVIKVEQQVRTSNGGEFDRLTIRTRNRELVHLDLGPGGACEGCFQVGDRVRARARAADGAGAARRVGSLSVRRGNQRSHYVNDGGRMVSTARAGRPGVGIHDRDRDRIHALGTGQAGGRGQGGGGRRGGGS